MKLNLPASNQEKVLPDDVRLVSTTDLKGIITSANDAFVEVSGYSREELLGASHNIVRHPDMPPEAFADMWNTLKSGAPWIGIVKNRCKNGDHYWVDAHATPLYDEDQLVGYQSVRYKAAPDLVARADGLYRRIMSAKSEDEKRRSVLATPPLGRAVGIRTQVFGASVAAVAVLLGVALSLGAFALPGAAVAVMVAVGAAYAFAHVVSRRWVAAATESSKIVDNPLMQYVYAGSRDECGRIVAAARLMGASLRSAIGRIAESSEEVAQMAGQTARTSERSGDAMKQQHSETDQVATAMNEMTATVQEIARNAAAAAEAACRADKEAVSGKEVVEQTVGAIGSLTTEVERAASVIQRLEDDSNNIGRVLDVIRDIAEQTNLLALNAAIEAARAGEQGRGFAVVADEVRTLASRTQSSTAEIQDMIQRLQRGAEEAVAAMTAGRDKATTTTDQAARAGQALLAIAGAVGTITDMNTQIASAAEEQSVVAEEINRNITNISQSADHTLAEVEQATRASEQLAMLARGLESTVVQYRL